MNMQPYIHRWQEKNVLRKMKPNKVMIILGSRRTGKTFFIRYLVDNIFKEPVLQLNGEDMDTIDILKRRSVENYKRLIGKNRILVIDEAQKIPEIGSILKLIVDTIEGIKIMVTGSSVFDLTNKLGEPLAGRHSIFHLYPFAQAEYGATENILQTNARLEERMIFGNYPELLQCESYDEKASYLKELTRSVLLKDLMEYEGVRNSSKMFDLLRLLSFQTGKEVSLEELGRQLMLSRNTIEKYLDLLSKVFIIFRLPGFSRNLRSEVTKTNRWYFFDNGVRNAVISNFNPIAIRNDYGELWENFIVSERVKFQDYSGMIVNNYFWRTYQQQEIDWIEEREGELFAYEMKWNTKKKVKIPSAWLATYPDSKFLRITPENYLDWIT
jgi:uncharacterized protein